MSERRESMQVKQTMSDMMYFLANDKFIERAIEECGKLLNPPPSFLHFVILQHCNTACVYDLESSTVSHSKPVFERCSARSGNQKALFQGAATSMEEKKPVFERCSARSGNQKALFQGAATSMEEKTPVHEETEIFATPTQPAPRRATRPSTRRTSRRGIDNSTTDRTTSFSSSSSQSLSRSNVSPLFMSPLTRLEAAVNALESTEEEKKKLTLNQGDFCPSRQLYDPNVSYLLDQSPSVLSQEHQTKTPPPGGLIVPAFGSRHYNITSKSVFSARAEDETTLHPLQPKATQTMTTDSAKTVNKGNCRRFFTSTFAERNKREVERHFLEMVGELSDPSTLKPGGRQLKSGKKVGDAGVAKRQVKNQKKPKRQTKKTKSKIKLSFLEDTQTDNNSDVDSVPRSSENDAGGPDESACKFRSRPAIRQAAKVARKDDQLMIGLSRFGKETVATKVETIKKPPGGGTGIVDLDDGVGWLCFECIGTICKSQMLRDCDQHPLVEMVKCNSNRLHNAFLLLKKC
nr:hypothetical transcript [Hymenolepis microstoma]